MDITNQAAKIVSKADLVKEIEELPDGSYIHCTFIKKEDDEYRTESIFHPSYTDSIIKMGIRAAVLAHVKHNQHL